MPRWLSDDEERAWRALQLMELRLEAELAHDLAAAGDLSYSEYLVLVGLTDVDGGRLRSFELAAHLSWERSRLSHLAARMEARGLLTREACESDRRGSYLQLSEAGRRAIEEAAPVHLASVRRLFFDHLTAAQVVAVGDAAASVLAALGHGAAGHLGQPG
jgi:DNA-binding MarR family transcriptional regulator